MERLMETVKRLRSLQFSIPSPLLRLWVFLRRCHELYRLEVWLSLYYPLLYFAEEVQRFGELSVAQVIMISVVSLGVLAYSFYHSYFWRPDPPTDSGFQQEEDPTNSQGKESDLVFNTPADLGLSQAEVITRREKYGTNEIWRRRNWGPVLMCFSIGAPNLLLEVSGTYPQNAL